MGWIGATVPSQASVSPHDSRKCAPLSDQFAASAGRSSATAATNSGGMSAPAGTWIASIAVVTAAKLLPVSLGASALASATANAWIRDGARRRRWSAQLPVFEKPDSTIYRRL